MEVRPTPATEPDQAKADLWRRSTGWRNLVVGAAVLTAAAGGALWLSGGGGQAPGPAPRAAKPPPPSAALSPQPVIKRAESPAHPAAPLVGAEPAPAPHASVEAVRPAARIAPQRPPAAEPAVRAVAPDTDPLVVANPAPQACLMTMRPAPNRFGHGVVLSIEEPSVSAGRTRMKEAALGGRIDPDYAADTQVTVRMTNGDNVVFTAPKSITPRVGDEVSTQNMHRSMNLPCNYVPPLVTADLGPAPAGFASPQAAAPSAGASAPQALAQNSDSCPIGLPFKPRRFGAGVVVAEVPPQLALAAIARDEVRARGKMDSSYVDRRRVRVRLNDHDSPIAVVPPNMSVKVGDRVGLQDGYRSQALPCGWIPNMVTDDFGPAPTGPDKVPAQ